MSAPGAIPRVRPVSFSRSRWLRKGAFLIVVLAFATAPLLVPALRFEFTIIIASALAALAVGLMLRAGLISFGHALYYAAGAYAVAYLAPGLNAGLSLLLAGAMAGGVLALACGWFVVRYRGIFFAMLNLALSMVGYMVLLKFYTLTGGSDGLQVSVSRVAGLQLDPASFGIAWFYVALLLAIVLGCLLTRYLRSPLGWGLGAVQNCELRVGYLGLSVHRTLLVAYVLSGVLAGFGGAISAVAVGHVVPELSYWTTSAQFLVIAVLGGVGGVLGPFVGAALYQLLSVNAAQYLSHTWGFVLGVAILVVIRFAPVGLWGIYDRWWTTRRRG